MEEGKNCAAQNLRGGGSQTEQILRSRRADYGELGRFASWHIGCIRRTLAAHEGAEMRWRAEFNQNRSIR
jgi:hypothetical protein